MALGPENAEASPAACAACRRAPEPLQPAVEWALSSLQSRGARVNLRPLAEYQSVFLLAVVYLLRGLLLAILTWPPAVVCAVGVYAGCRAYRAYIGKVQRTLQRVWLELEHWWKIFESLFI